jgi:cytidylate kinase
MSIITISRGSFYRGKEVAEKLAQKLGYECFSRDSILEGLDEFHLREIRLVRDLNDAVSILERFSYGKERFIIKIRWALLDQFRKDNIVYHGLAGHYFVKEISHTLKIRIIADMESRVKEEMKRENISARKARNILKKDDDERRNWSLYLYGIDTWNPDQYDMVLNIAALTVDDAVDIIANAIHFSRFQTTPDSQKKIENMALAARVHSSLFEYPNAKVNASEGDVIITIKAPLDQKQEITTTVRNSLKDISGIKKVDVQFEPYL